MPTLKRRDGSEFSIQRHGDRKKERIMAFLDSAPEGVAYTIQEAVEAAGYAPHTASLRLNSAEEAELWSRYRFLVGYNNPIYANPKTIKAIRDGKFAAKGIGPKEYEG